MNNWLSNIKKRIITRVPALKNNENLLLDLLDEAFVSIVTYANANSYKREWDTLLVTCVATLYNYVGNEGSLSRSSNGVSDSYASSDILAPILAGRIQPYIKPTGYEYSANRFDFPN